MSRYAAHILQKTGVSEPVAHSVAFKLSTIPVTQTVIAAMCGVSRAAFSEHVQPLASNGWLSISYGRIELLSIATWNRFSRARRADPKAGVNPAMEELLAELHRASVM